MNTEGLDEEFLELSRRYGFHLSRQRFKELKGWTDAMAALRFAGVYADLYQRKNLEEHGEMAERFQRLMAA